MSDLQLPPMDVDPQDDIKILTAPWVVPVSSPTLSAGGVVVARGKIVDIGKGKELLARYPGIREEKYDTVLLPGLVNAHMHLELSHLKDIPPPHPSEFFTDWIKALLAQRQDNIVSKTEVVESFSQVLVDQMQSGVALVADVGNEYFTDLHAQKKRKWPMVLRMLEFVGPNEAAFLSAQKTLSELSDEFSATAHAPYSTIPRLLVELKKRCRKRQQLFSVHTAETRDEIEFLRHRTGCFRDFLASRNSWDDSFFDNQNSYLGTIHYYEQLGLLDERTLLVHCVHVSDEELHLVKNKKSSICLCPGSNKFLRVGVAPVENMLAAGILPALGTDSLASNEKLDLWREMQIVSEQYPNVAADKILAMATLWGACALGRDSEFGSLHRGKSGHLIHATSTALQKCNNINELERELVSGGRPSEISWVDTVH